MKKIAGLDDKVVPLSADNNDGMPTFRECLKLLVGKGSAKTADEARRITRIVNKLRTANGELELADEEFKVLVEKIVANHHGFIADIQGQLLEKLDPSKE